MEWKRHTNIGWYDDNNKDDEDDDDATKINTQITTNLTRYFTAGH